MERQRESLEALRFPEKVAIATTTSYKNWPDDESDRIRGNLALQSIDNALARGFHVCIVDGGSSEAFHRELQQRKIVFENERERGMSASRRQVFTLAENQPGAEVICWMEPEKLSLLTDDLFAQAAEPILRGDADVIVPARTEESWQTYPTYQQDSEKRANTHLNGLLRTRGLLTSEEDDLDLFFGPRIYANRPEVRELFHRQFAKKEKITKSTLHKIVDPERYSDATFFPIANALQKGLRVESVSIEYRHPPKQTAFEEGNSDLDRKRDAQRRTIVTEMIHLLRLQKEDPRSHLS